MGILEVRLSIISPFLLEAIVLVVQKGCSLQSSSKQTEGYIRISLSAQQGQRKYKKKRSWPKWTGPSHPTDQCLTKETFQLG
ncbi:hypothetical protein EAE96_009287 [Botrytis aclada]|nr:hypothetical protein EAE96_009287 [Botrytis aclada]